MLEEDALTQRCTRRGVQAALMRMYCFTGGIFETRASNQIYGYSG
jgi:hypothetical protein